jgi:hypothetical protein
VRARLAAEQTWATLSQTAVSVDHLQLLLDQAAEATTQKVTKAVGN